MGYALDLHVIFVGDQETDPAFDLFEDAPGFERVGESATFRETRTGVTTTKLTFSGLVEASVYHVRLPHRDQLAAFLAQHVTAAREALIAPPPIDEFGPATLTIVHGQDDEARTSRQSGDPVFSVSDGALDDPAALLAALAAADRMGPREDEMEDDEDIDPAPITVAVPPEAIAAAATLGRTLPAREKVFYVGSPTLDPGALTTAVFAALGVSSYTLTREPDEAFHAESEIDGGGIGIGSVLSLPSRGWMDGLSGVVEVQASMDEYAPASSPPAVEAWAMWFGLCLVTESDPDDDPIRLIGHRRQGETTRPLADRLTWAEIEEVE